jgi:hypothetical protein
MVGIEREIHNQTVCIQQGVNLTGANYIQNEMLTAGYPGATPGLRQRFLIRFAINRNTSITPTTSTYSIVSGGIFACYGGNAISVQNDKLWIYGINTNIDVAYGQYFEIVCGGEGYNSAHVNGTQLDGTFFTCHNAPQVIRNCILFELLTGYGNSYNFLNNAPNANTNAPQLVKKIYNGGKGSDVTKMRFYYGRNYLNQSITAPSVHVRFEQGNYVAATRDFNRLKTDQIGNRTIYQPSGTPTFIQRIGTQIII